jgi:hypothetical protein
MVSRDKLSEAIAKYEQCSRPCQTVAYKREREEMKDKYRAAKSAAANLGLPPKQHQKRLVKIRESFNRAVAKSIEAERSNMCSLKRCEKEFRLFLKEFLRSEIRYIKNVTGTTPTMAKRLLALKTLVEQGTSQDIFKTIQKLYYSNIRFINAALA